MCETKDEAGTKIDRLIRSMDRLSEALEDANASRGASTVRPETLTRAQKA